MARLGAHFRFLAAAVCAVVALAWCSTALAVPGGVTLTSPPTDSTPSFAWFGDPLSTFDWDINGPGGFRSGSTALPGVQVAPALPDGNYAFRVREVSLGLAGEWSPSVAALIDTTPPTISVRTPSAGLVAQAGALVIADYSCAGGATICRGAVADGLQIGTARIGPRDFTVDARDAAGNIARVVVPWIIIDRTPPTQALLTSPVGGTIIGTARPTLTWVAASDLGGIGHYDIFINGQFRATVAGGATRWTPPQNLAAGAYTWSVTAVDTSGNATLSAPASFVIDTSAPPPPTITQEPADPGANRSPIIAWTGIGPTYTYTLRRTGQNRPVAGPTTIRTTTVTLGPPLADGAYLFRLNQTNAFGRVSADLEVSFRVDGTAPGAPVVTSRPPTPSATPAPSFGWSPAEPGGSFAWEVLSASGAGLLSAQSVSPETTTSPLAPGSYSFVVRQLDDAGNVGPPSSSEAFEISPPPAGPGSTVAPTIAGRIRPKTLTARRLTPRAGAKVPNHGVTLRWTHGPRLTRLYNLQIFLVRKSGTVVKVLSRFPRATEYTVPSGRLHAGRRYIWRVWPSFAGARLAPHPVGVSFFDVSAKASRRR